MRGFTLIETLVYIALLAFLLTAGVLTSYTLATNSDKINTSTSTHDEGNFVLRKIDWALSDAESISLPSSGLPYNGALGVTRTDGTRIDISITPENKIQIREGGTSGSYTPLTTDNVAVSALHFGYIPGTPSGIEASTTINGVVFTTRRYLAK